MDRNEILQSAQANGDKGKEYERHTRIRSDNIAAAIGVLLCTAMAVLKLIVARKLDFGLFAILFAIDGTQRLVEGKKLHKTVSVIFGIIEELISVIFLAAYIGETFAK